MERYKNPERIGRGSFGVVNKYTDSQNNDSVVAVKSIEVEHEKYIDREIIALKALQHDNIVRLQNEIHSGGCSYLVLEFLDIDLKTFIHEKLYSNFSCSTPNLMTKAEVKSYIVKRFLFQILQGVSYCHSQNFIHRDLKPDNLLIHLESLTIKLADFGLARRLDDTSLYTAEIGNLSYRSPEQLIGAGHNYSKGVDIWSVGCIFAEMETTERLFRSTSVGDQFNNIHGLFETEAWPDGIFWGPFMDPSLLERLSSQNNMRLASLVPAIGGDGLDLLSKMLTVNPRNRITADDALEHKYFENIPYIQLKYEVPH